MYVTIDVFVFLSWVINIYLIKNKERIGGTKSIFVYNVYLKYSTVF